MARRKRSPHPGVTIRRRKIKSGTMYSYRFVDPLTGRTVERKFDRKLFKDDTDRRTRAGEISKEITRRREELASGIALKTWTLIDDGIESFVSFCEAERLKQETITKYKYAAKYFSQWTNESRITSVEKINYQTLKGFLVYLQNRHKEAPRAGGRAGERSPTTERLTTSTIDGILRSVKVLLRYWRETGVLRLPSEEIQKGLRLKIKKDQFESHYFKPADCRKLLEAALRHDEENIAADETDAQRIRLLKLAAERRAPIAHIVLFFLLSGCRHKEVRYLRWDRVQLDALDPDGRQIGEIYLTAEDTKTHTSRTIGLEVCPTLRKLLALLKLHAGDDPYVFGGVNPLPPSSLGKPRERLSKIFGVRKFTWQHLRQTTGTYLTNAPGIYSAASIYLAARQLGHSVVIAEKHYWGVERGIPREARTLEEAMQIEDLAKRIIDRVSARTFGTTQSLFAPKNSKRTIPSEISTAGAATKISYRRRNNA